MFNIIKSFRTISRSEFLLPGLGSLIMGLLVTFLWSSSYIFIKFGLDELSPFFFAAVRYSLASMILLIASFTKRKKIFLNSKWSLDLSLNYGFMAVGRLVF